jgi:hypothetical protein
MDWNRFRPLLIDQMHRMVQLSLKSQTAAQPPEVEKVMACLQDGSIDPGDSEQVSRGLLALVVAMPEYQAVVDFHKERRGELAALNRALAEASDEDYTAYIELGQRIAAEMVTEALLGMLVKVGVLKDNRGN